MSTRQEYHVMSNSSAANFKDWANSFFNALTAFGWTQTTDTGQADFSTNPAVPANNTYLYQIWHPTDSLQATKPYYAKFEFGNGNNGNTDNPAFRVSIGDGTNGSGTITSSVGSILGPFSPGGASWIINGQGSTAYECDYSGDTGRFGALMWRTGGTNVQAFLAIERSLDSSGNPTNEYVTVIMQGPDGSNSRSYGKQISYVFGAGAAGRVSPIHLLNDFQLNGNEGGASTFNNTFCLSPVFPFVGKFGNPMTVCAAAPTTDVTEGAQYQTTLYGSTRVYLATKQANVMNAFGNSCNDNTPRTVALLMRFD
jgi:hypothetical protein